MRTAPLKFAALLSFACSVPAFAQSARLSSQPDDAAPETMAPETMAPDVTPPVAVPSRTRHSAQPQSGADRETATREVWAHEPGTGLSGPASDRASNIDMGNTRSPIAPHFPEPRGGPNAGWRNYLREADSALAMRHTGEAQQALEMAETRLLDRSTPVEAADQPSQSPVVQQVSAARQALGSGDILGARSAIQTALGSSPGEGLQDDGMAPVPRVGGSMGVTTPSQSTKAGIGPR